MQVFYLMLSVCFKVRKGKAGTGKLHSMNRNEKMLLEGTDGDLAEDVPGVTNKGYMLDEFENFNRFTRSIRVCILVSYQKPILISH